MYVTLAERPPIAAVVALGITQIVGYGTLYYSYSILAGDMAAALGWTTEWLFGVLSAGLLAGGLTMPWLGTWIDRVGAGRIMSIGSVLAAAALVACALAPGGKTFMLAMIAAQCAGNFVQYGAAFALLVQLGPHSAPRSITYLTMIAGFSSTLFWPFTSALHEAMSWRGIYLLFAVLNLVICLPLHIWLARSGTRSGKTDVAGPRPVIGSLPQSLRATGLLLMTVAFSLQNLVSSAMLVHMVPVLSGLGLGASAAVVATLFGPAQVLGRLLNMLFGRNLPPLWLAVLAALLMAGGIFILAPTAPSLAGAMAFALVFGTGNGLFSIAAGSLPLALFGSEGYGRLQGRVMSARLVLSATAPFALAYAMAHLGIKPSLAIVALLGAVPAVLFVAIGMLIRRRTRV